MININKSNYKKQNYTIQTNNKYENSVSKYKNKNNNYNYCYNKKMNNKYCYKHMMDVSLLELCINNDDIQSMMKELVLECKSRDNKNEKLKVYFEKCDKFSKMVDEIK